MALPAVISHWIRGPYATSPTADSISWLLSRLFKTSDYTVSNLLAPCFSLTTFVADESVGHLMVVVNNTTQLETVRSQLERILLDHDKQCASSIVSSVVAKVLTTKRLRKDWYKSSRIMIKTCLIQYS